MSEGKEVKLKFPIEVKTSNGNMQEVSTITLGRIKAKHLTLLPDSMFEGDESNAKVHPRTLIPLIAGLAGIEEEAAGEIDMEDLTTVSNELQDLMEGLMSPETGSK